MLGKIYIRLVKNERGMVVNLKKITNINKLEVAISPPDPLIYADITSDIADGQYLDACCILVSSDNDCLAYHVDSFNTFKKVSS